MDSNHSTNDDAGAPVWLYALTSEQFYKKTSLIHKLKTTLTSVEEQSLKFSI